MGADQLPSQQDSEVPKNDECQVFGMQTFEKRLHSEDFAFLYRHSIPNLVCEKNRID